VTLPPPRSRARSYEGRDPEEEAPDRLRCACHRGRRDRALAPRDPSSPRSASGVRGRDVRPHRQARARHHDESWGTQCAGGNRRAADGRRGLGAHPSLLRISRCRHGGRCREREGWPDPHRSPVAPLRDPDSGRRPLPRRPGSPGEGGELAPDRRRRLHPLRRDLRCRWLGGRLRPRLLGRAREEGERGLLRRDPDPRLRVPRRTGPLRRFVLPVRGESALRSSPRPDGRSPRLWPRDGTSSGPLLRTPTSSRRRPAHTRSTFWRRGDRSRAGRRGSRDGQPHPHVPCLALVRPY